MAVSLDSKAYRKIAGDLIAKHKGYTPSVLSLCEDSMLKEMQKILDLSIDHSKVDSWVILNRRGDTRRLVGVVRCEYIDAVAAACCVRSVHDYLIRQEEYPRLYEVLVVPLSSLEISGV